MLKAVAVPGGLVVRVQALTSLRGLVDATSAAAAEKADASAAAGFADVEGQQGSAQGALQGGMQVEGGGAQVAGAAWVCLGKMCLADESLAKKCLPLFVQVRGNGGGHCSRGCTVGGSGTGSADEKRWRMRAWPRSASHCLCR